MGDDNYKWVFLKPTKWQLWWNSNNLEYGFEVLGIFMRDHFFRVQRWVGDY